MNLKRLVKLSNVVALVAIVLLIYWVFTFVVTQVFGFRVFRENISETFALSVLGIISLMAGSLIINVMFNLTRIAERHDKDVVLEVRGFPWKLGSIGLLSFALVFGLLYAGDRISAKRRESRLVAAAKSVVDRYPAQVDQMLDYKLDKAWVGRANEFVRVVNKTDRNFPNVDVIVTDKVLGVDSFLIGNNFLRSEDEQPLAQDFIAPTSDEERRYLASVFFEGNTATRFVSNQGNYELFFPVVRDGKRMVLRFSDYQRYGKLGS